MSRWEHGESTHGYFVLPIHHARTASAEGARRKNGRQPHRRKRQPDRPGSHSAVAFRGGNGETSRRGSMRRRGAVAGPRQLYSESYYGRFNFGWSELRSLLSGNWKYIAAPIPESHPCCWIRIPRRLTTWPSSGRISSPACTRAWSPWNPKMSVRWNHPKADSIHPHGRNFAVSVIWRAFPSEPREPPIHCPIRKTSWAFTRRWWVRRN